jgi:hypothetical protein
LIPCWFAISVLAVVFGNLVFKVWLERKGVKIGFLFAGTPGYLDYLYFKSCKKQGVSPNKFIFAFRVLSLTSAILSAVFLAGIQNGKY